MRAAAEPDAARTWPGQRPRCYARRQTRGTQGQQAGPPLASTLSGEPQRAAGSGAGPCSRPALARDNSKPSARLGDPGGGPRPRLSAAPKAQPRPLAPGPDLPGAPGPLAWPRRGLHPSPAGPALDAFLFVFTLTVSVGGSLRFGTSFQGTDPFLSCNKILIL